MSASLRQASGKARKSALEATDPVPTEGQGEPEMDAIDKSARNLVANSMSLMYTCEPSFSLWTTLALVRGEVDIG